MKTWGKFHQEHVLLLAVGQLIIFRDGQQVYQSTCKEPKLCIHFVIFHFSYPIDALIRTQFLGDGWEYDFSANPAYVSVWKPSLRRRRKKKKQTNTFHVGHPPKTIFFSSELFLNPLEMSGWSNYWIYRIIGNMWKEKNWSF